MEFFLEYDTLSSTIRASGRDNPGYFTIFGFFDGNDMRFIKRYSSYEWKYIGTATAQGEDVYQVSGGWGTGRVQHGSFAFTALGVGNGGARKLSSAVRLEGEWTGSFFYSSDARQPPGPTMLYLSAKPGRHLHGNGTDGPAGASFGVVGSYDGAAVNFTKTYSDNSYTWIYTGVVDPSGTRLRGTWGDGMQTFGTFSLMKGRSIAYAQAQGFMPRKNKLWGRGGVTVRNRLQEQDSALLEDGFSELL